MMMPTLGPLLPLLPLRPAAAAAAEVLRREARPSGSSWPSLARASSRLPASRLMWPTCMMGRGREGGLGFWH